jgi:hypothetical protein
VIAFVGGVNHVIHAGTILKVTKLVQRARPAPYPQQGATKKVYIFDAVDVMVEMFAEDVEAKTATIKLPEGNYEL